LSNYDFFGRKGRLRQKMIFRPSRRKVMRRLNLHGIDIKTRGLSNLTARRVEVKNLALVLVLFFER